MGRTRSSRLAVVTVVALAGALGLGSTVAPAGAHTAGARVTAKKKRAAPRCPHRPKRRARRPRARRGAHRSPARCRAAAVPFILSSRGGPRLRSHLAAGPYSPTPSRPFGRNGDELFEQHAHLPLGAFLRPPRSIRARTPLPPGDQVPAEDASAALLRSAGPTARTSGVGDIAIARNLSLKSPLQPVASDLAVTDGPEQSVATDGRLVLYTANTFGALSTDGGRSFSTLDPRKVFPSTGGGVCCDQVVTYIPSQQRFVWVIQYWTRSFICLHRSCAYPTNVIRIATATASELAASAGRSWRYYDFVPADFGVAVTTNNRFILDRAFLATTSGMLHVTLGVLKNDDGIKSVVFRVPLSQLGASRISYRYLTVGQGTWIRPAQNAESTPGPYQYFAHFITNSRLEVLSWLDSNANPTFYEVDVPTVGTKNFSSATPAGGDWMRRTAEKQSEEVLTGARAGGKVWFAWVAGRQAEVSRKGKTVLVGVHDQPAIEAVGISQLSLQVTDYDGIEYSNAAVDVPLLRANRDGELGISYMFGGPTDFPTHAVGFLRNAYAAARSATGGRPYESIPESAGDYTGLTTDPTQPNCFIAAGSAPKSGVPGTKQTDNYYDPRFVMFGRAAAGCRVLRRPVVTTPAPPRPDLVIDSIDLNTQTSTVGVSVRNAGSVKAGASKTGVTFQGNPELLLDTPALDPGQATTLNAQCPSSGTFSFTARVDATRLVSESDEGNNSRSRTVTCPG